MLDKLDLINKILISNSPLTVYEKNISSLYDTRFLLFDNNSKKLPESYNLKKFDKYIISPIANYENTIVIDKNTFDKTVQIPMTHCIDFDSNIVGDLKSLYFSKKSNENFIKMLLYLKRELLQINCSPYMFECAANKFKLKTEDSYNSLLAFSLFENTNIESLLKRDFRNPELENYIETDIRWKTLNELKRYSNEEYIPQYYYLYCLILKMYYINFSSKKSTKYKYLELLDSINNELYSYWENELALCFMFFKGEEKTKRFFGAVQPNSKEPLRKIAGMAWDLYHLRCLLKHMAERNNATEKVYLHSFLSADSGLNNLISLNPIERIAFHKSEIYPRYKYNIFEICPEIDIYKILHYHREQRIIKAPTIDYKQLSLKLENDLLSLFSI